MKRASTPPLTWNYENMMADRIGPSQGLAEEEITQAIPRLHEIDQLFQADRKKGRLPFLNLPYQSTEEVKRLARAARRYENFVLLGIGGSALGPIALHQALHSPYHNFLSQKARGGPKMFFLDNVDPAEVAPLFDLLNPRRTIVNVVTKSGETLETLAQFLLFQNWIYKKLGKKEGARRFIVTTDPNRGTLREIAQKEGYATLEIPEPIGGRYSIFTPVGLFPAAVSGIDVDLLLEGAAEIDQMFQKLSPIENGAILGALAHYWSYTARRRNILVTMPYAEALGGVAQWFSQLWAESLGKENSLRGEKVQVGQTPVVAIGATDQHSQLQLYMEGPLDKTVQFLTVEAAGRDLKLPSVRLIRRSAPGLSKGPLGLLSRHTLGGLLRIEQKGIELSLTEAGRPNCKITLPALDPFSVGALFYFFEYQTAFAGRLYGVNPFDQPGVEAGKKIIQRLLKEEA